MNRNYTKQQEKRSRYVLINRERVRDANLMNYLLIRNSIAGGCDYGSVGGRYCPNETINFMVQVSYELISRAR